MENLLSMILIELFFKYEVVNAARLLLYNCLYIVM